MLYHRALISTAFPSPRSHDPGANLRIHPGERLVAEALHQQAVARIDVDPETRTMEMTLDNVLQHGKHLPQCRAIAGPLCVAVDGVKVPECGVGRVIDALVPALGEQVGNQAVANLMGVGPKYRAGFGRPTGVQQQTFED